MLILRLSFLDYFYFCQESTIIIRAHDNTLDRRCWMQANALSFASRETPPVCFSAEQTTRLTISSSFNVIPNIFPIINPEFPMHLVHN